MRTRGRSVDRCAKVSTLGHAAWSGLLALRGFFLALEIQAPTWASSDTDPMQIALYLAVVDWMPAAVVLALAAGFAIGWLARRVLGRRV